MTDVIYYLGSFGIKHVIEGFKNIYHIPNIEEKVIIGNTRYIIKERMFDYDKNVVHIKVVRVGAVKDKLYNY